MKPLLFLIAATVSLTAVTAQKLFTYPIGVQTYTFRDHFQKGVEKTLDEIKSLGFTEIEGNAPKGMTE